LGQRISSTLKALRELTSADLSGIDPALLERFKKLARCGLVGDYPLYTHQTAMLKLVLSGRNAVVTAGTGSGKTEAFLLPLFAYLAAEKSRWARPGVVPAHFNDWWANTEWQASCRSESNRLTRSYRVPQRAHEKRPAAVEFGHVIVLSQTKEKFISDYDAMEHRIPDPYLTMATVEKHERLFGEPPKVLTGDRGFNPESSVRAALEEKVETLAIPRKLSDWASVIGSAWQRFRAGIEGSISVLKRAFRLLRCPYRGFRSFASSVGLSIFCHNLVLLARPPGK